MTMMFPRRIEELVTAHQRDRVEAADRQRIAATAGAARKAERWTNRAARRSFS
jgi:hypothetical protein